MPRKQRNFTLQKSLDFCYAIAFEMGASLESLAFPREQEKLQAVFDEIIDSFEVIPIDR